MGKEIDPLVKIPLRVESVAASSKVAVAQVPLLKTKTQVDGGNDAFLDNGELAVEQQTAREKKRTKPKFCVESMSAAWFFPKF
jgi:hypothetical protein